MSGASGGSVDKAFFYNMDAGSYFTVQYNPKDFKFNKAVSWKEHDDQGQEASLEFQKNSPATMQVELIFDTTQDLSDVREVWVNKVLELTNPDYTPTEGEVESMDKKRPPIVYFIWGAFGFYGVVESVDVTFVMFGSDGNPLRAKVAIKMKEWGTETYQSSGGGSYYDSAPVKLVTLQAGQTVSAVAIEMGTTAQAIGEANGFDDLTDVPAGTTMIVPMS